MSHSHIETDRGASTVLTGAVVVLVLASVLIAFMFGAFDRGDGGDEALPGTGGAADVVPGAPGGGSAGGGAQPRAMRPSSLTPGHLLS